MAGGRRVAPRHVEQEMLTEHESSVCCKEAKPVRGHNHLFLARQPKHMRGLANRYLTLFFADKAVLCTI